MRYLYLVPMLHNSADMGSAAGALNEAGSEELSSEVWQAHLETVAAFWASLDGFFAGLDAQNFKIYQDGLVAGGEDGIKIVREGAAQGSRNYGIIDGLLTKGAVLMPTESLPLVKQEYDFISKITRVGSPREKEAAIIRYKLARGGLLKSRDGYIARQIGETLAAGETGILFIGAYHNVTDRLDQDIRLLPVKDPEKVREYHHALTNLRREGRLFKELGEYLAAPVAGVSFVSRSAAKSGTR